MMRLIVTRDYCNKDAVYIETKTPEQKAFNRRRFFKGRIESFARHYNATFKSDSDYKKETGKSPIRPVYQVWHELSALRAVASNRIVQCEAFGLRKATLS